MAAERIRGDGVHRRRATDGPRRHEVRVRLSAAENRELRRRATEGKVSLSRYLVESALDRPATATERRVRKSELHHVDRLIAGLATNISQLARVAHATAQVPAETAEALDELKRLTVAVETIAAGAGYDLVGEP
jgi:uncharacterized protein YfaA (DUF2138 family)